MDSETRKALERIQAGEDKVSYVNSKGQRCVVVRVDTVAIELRHKADIDRAARCLTEETLTALEVFTSYLRNHEPTVGSYKEEAMTMSKILEEAYAQVGPSSMKESNIFHHPIKQINPEIYGKAETFMKELKKLEALLEEVREAKEKIFY